MPGKGTLASVALDELADIEIENMQITDTNNKKA